jgi:hypothetical protein
LEAQDRDGFGHEEENEKNEEEPDPEEDQDQPTFSTVTGKYIYRKRFGTTSSSTTTTTTSSSKDKDKDRDGGALIPRSTTDALLKSTTSNHAAAHFLQTRTFQGLDPRMGQDEPGVLEMGREGVARGYGNEPAAKEEQEQVTVGRPGEEDERTREDDEAEERQEKGK